MSKSSAPPGPRVEALSHQPVLSREARDVGWRLYGEEGPPTLSPTVERRLSNVLVLEHHLGPCVGQRLADAQCKPFLAVVYIIAGSTWGYGPRGSHDLKAGDLATWHSSQSVAFQVDEMVRKVVFFFEVDEVGPLSLDPALCDASIPRNSPFGAVLGGMFAELWRKLDSIPSDYHSSVLAVARDAVSQVLRSASRAQEQRPGSTLFERIVSHIERRFDDPELSPASIASALGISLRYLHLLFAQRGLTAGTWIRERRLAYCREALCSAGSQWSVTEVALRAGFSDPSHFSRVFRQRFGVAPSEFRRQRLETPTSARS